MCIRDREKVPDGESREGRAVRIADFTGKRAQARFFFMTSGIEVHMDQSRISRHYNRSEMRQRIRVGCESSGFTSLMTVIQGGRKGHLPECRVKKIPVSSALKGITYPDSMAEAVNIQVDDHEYVVIICHQEVNSPTDLEEADGCMGYGNVIVFDKKRERLVGTVLHY